MGLIAPVKRSAARERSRAFGRTELASGYETLHPPRPSGRSPHRPLIFLGRRSQSTVESSKRKRGRDGFSDETGRFVSRLGAHNEVSAKGTTVLDMTCRSGHGVPCPYELGNTAKLNWLGQKKKRALTDRPSELNHFDDTLAGSEPPAPANHHEEQWPEQQAEMKKGAGASPLF